MRCIIDVMPALQGPVAEAVTGRAIRMVQLLPCRLGACTDTCDVIFPQSGRLPNGDETFYGAKLPIAHITRQMAGVYECVADNKLNIKAVGRISLQVQCKYDMIVPH